MMAKIGKGWNRMMRPNGKRTRGSQATDGVLDSASCIARMQSLYETLTPVQKRLADTVLKDPHSVILASVGELAARSGSSEGAVSRFSRVLGYSSYAEFKLALSRDLVGSTQAIHEDVAKTDGIETIADKVARSNILAIEDTLRSLDRTTLQRAVNALQKADRLAFFGFGVSSALARDARHHFLRTVKETVFVEDTHEQVMWAATARPTDVVVLFSHSGTSRDLCEIADLATARKAVTMSITNYGKSPLTDRTKINLFTSSRETRYREESISSRIAALTIIDILYVAVSINFADEQAKLRETIRQALQSKRI
ncbi:MAG: SIS domain-containing protein [Mesorhizobium sp.]|nr:MAG: MurR/RpiR family transcriptional regulator [Mesorhizobium sp.]RWL34670.1 MAG: MurR/RpiR family transcriptional regulator [Mesorhizobium sp.]RWL36083.1 MAG: MurR/RpiR family transcriptional regulator [Mesorhizobium sp.]RWL50652.1 MAG: MurR/RpiR family transcriptional regulator [Mesorhizobium sp.]RWL64954.1 MAG: MurR/RpiR family transcriptional regulator [Mesorhizobium sp.]